MKYLILVLCGFLSCMKVTIQGRLARKSIITTYDSIFANCLVFAFTALIFSVALGEKIKMDIIGYAALFGVFSASFQIFYALALKSGPFSISCLMVNLSMVLPAVFSVVFLDEKLTVLKVIGVLLCITALVLNTKKDNVKANFKWFLYVFLAFLSTGSISIVQKLYAKSPVAGELPQFLFLGYLVAFLITFIFVLAQKVNKNEGEFKITKSNLMFIFGIVICLGAFQYFCTMANSFIDAIVLNPSVSGLSTMFLSISGVIVFKEHLSKRQILSICIGFLAIVLISI